MAIDEEVEEEVKIMKEGVLTIFTDKINENIKN